jgi:hypothetical protein
MIAYNGASAIPTERRIMARYVVVEFADNGAAEEFIAGINQLNKTIRKDGLVDFGRRVVGVFVKPGKTCGCPDANRANYGDKNWQPATIARGAKFGWWVCSRCKRPRKAGHSLVNQLRLSETYEGSIYEDYEFGVTDLGISGFHTKQIDRPKKLRRKKAK